MRPPHIVRELNGLRHDLRDVPRGFAYLGRGFKTLLARRDLWRYLAIPVALNVLLLSVLFVLVVALLRGFLVAALPETWWGLALAVPIYLAGIALFFLITVALFSVLGSVLASPFHERLAERLTASLGGVRREPNWSQALAQSFRDALSLLWWFLAVQAALFLFDVIVPLVFGPTAHAVCAFFATSLFLAIGYLEFPFVFQSWTFTKRRDWCMQHKGAVFGFGAAVFFGLAVPGLNVFVPPAAVAGGVLLFASEDKPSRSPYA